MEDLDVSFTKEFVCSVFNRLHVVGTAFLKSHLLIFVQISVSLNKDEPETPLTQLMRTKGADNIRQVLGSYVGYLKTGE